MIPQSKEDSARNKALDALPDAITKLTSHDPSHPPPQHQEFPGVTEEMSPKPLYVSDEYRGSEKLKGKVAIITGGDSGIGKSVAIYFAKEGCKGITIARLAKKEEHDAKETVRAVEAEGAQCLDIVADVSEEESCKKIVSMTIAMFGQLDIVVGNAGIQYYHPSIMDLPNEEIEKTFAVNVFANFYLTQAALPHMTEGASIIITTSMASVLGCDRLVDYSASKGSLQSFVTSLSLQLMDRGIRVNSVAPGTVYTPFIPATFPKHYMAEWSKFSPMKRVGQPCEVAPCYVFLASEDSSFFTGQTLHPIGGIPCAT